MKLTQTTQDWGNSTGIRLPKKILKAIKWQHDQLVSIDVRGDAIILKPVVQPKQDPATIDDLLKGVTPADVGGEMYWGSDRGLEIIEG